jgi:UDP-N-acetylmuramoyl-L-alanyl-D-glutamate--2,6-diaminopimelate ligase
MLNYLRKLIPDTHPIRLFYHKVMSTIAAIAYWFPADKMIVVGVTGTNGKTTVANLTTNILIEAGHKVGMVSTINFQIGAKKWVNTTKQTTFGAFKLQKLLRQMLNEDCKYVVLEVSSHAITQSRLVGVNVDVGVVTNITPDHVEYHGGFNNYLEAKGGLFQKVINGKPKFGVSKTLISNQDDKYFTFFNQFDAERKMTYGFDDATLHVSGLEGDLSGSRFTLHVPDGEMPVNFKMPGDYNVYNALAASSVAAALQVPLGVIRDGLEKSDSVSGRFEHVNCGQEFDVVVDYAHAPESLEALLEMYKERTPGRLFAVFGATGGGRDKGKRPRMGEVADKHADYIVLTDDDPYEEDEWEIIENIAPGIKRDEGRDFWKIPDRREAIRLALTMAEEGDTVVVAGKGCEEVMKLRGKTIPWNDRKVIEELLERKMKINL